jgi:hypothetical protein
MDSSTSKRVRVYVRLLDEGTEVSRPTEALEIGNGLFRIEATPDYDPGVETWEFVPGTIVGVQLRADESGDYLAAVPPDMRLSKP